MASGYVIRPCTATDDATIVAHRRAMFSEMGYRDNGIRAVILHASTDRRPLYEPLGFKSTIPKCRCSA